jgi:DNA-binding transcriptional ArsR family regulator
MLRAIIKDICNSAIIELSWSYPELVEWLRAVGEPSRLRLLVLCAEADVAVSDLAAALTQSEPRVSRHLKILCDAGLIERVRQGQWVHYRLVRSPAALSFVQGLLGQLDRSDPVLARDRERVRSSLRPGEAAPAAASESRLGRALRGFVEAVGAPFPVSRVLIVGVEHLELLESSVALAGECTVIAHSRRAAQSARSFAERHRFTCRVLLAAGAEGLNERDLERAGGLFDALLIDRIDLPESQLPVLLALGRRALAAGGRLWLFERYTSLGPGTRQPERARGEKVIEHPLAKLRRLLQESGLTCERLSPIEADGEHVLATVATVTAPAASVPFAT